MQTAGDVKMKVAALIGDPELDWLTDAYFYPLCNTAYQTATTDLSLQCSPYIERVVTIPGIPVGVDENNLGPNAQVPSAKPLQYLVKPGCCSGSRLELHQAGTGRCMNSPFCPTAALK